jgi:radical SAM superfamily enzyme YgiQ (UPF0313 family)
MILLIEPISKNIGMYVPAYPLPIWEIASFVKSNAPDIKIDIISIPMDFGLPLNKAGKNRIYREVLRDISTLKPMGIGISCTAISQSEEVIHLCNLIKNQEPETFIFLGGYPPTLYYKEMLSRTSSIDAIVIGEGEVPALKIIEYLEKGRNPVNNHIPNLAWKKDGKIKTSKARLGFDLSKKAPLRLDLLRDPAAYHILPYAFSRGCPFRCNFCMEEFIRPERNEVPPDIVRRDLKTLSQESNSKSLLISDALFNTFDIFPHLRSLGMKANFETRGDIIKPGIISKIAEGVGMIAVGFESASYSTLKRMNKVRNRSHFQKYIANTVAVFKEAVLNEIPVMIFMIGGYPGDTEQDLEESFKFAKTLSKFNGAGGHVFKIGECHAYPKTRNYELALSLPEVIFDNDGAFGQNIVRQPSKNLNFETIQAYTKEVFKLSNHTPKFHETFRNLMPFFRLPAHAFEDEIIPVSCFREDDRNIFNMTIESLSTFIKLAPQLVDKYENWMAEERRARTLPL